MSAVYILYIDSEGKKGSKRLYAEDNEDEIDFLYRVRDYFILLKSYGYNILRVFVLR